VLKGKGCENPADMPLEGYTHQNLLIGGKDLKGVKTTSFSMAFIIEK
jgi:hypothetical protein